MDAVGSEGRRQWDGSLSGEGEFWRDRVTELNTQAIEKLIYRTRIGLAPKVTGSVIYKVQATWRRFYCWVNTITQTVTASKVAAVRSFLQRFRNPITLISHIPSCVPLTNGKSRFVRVLHFVCTEKEAACGPLHNPSREGQTQGS